MKKDAATLVASGPQGNVPGVGVLLGTGSPNPEPTSDQKCHKPDKGALNFCSGKITYCFVT